MADLALQAFSLLQAAKDRYETMKGNKDAGKRLIERAFAVKPTVEKLKKNPMPEANNALLNLADVLRKLQDYVNKYSEKCWWREVNHLVFAKTYMKDFGALDLQLSNAVNDLSAVSTIGMYMSAAAKPSTTQRRQEALIDAQASIEAICREIVAELQSREGTSDEIDRLQAEMQQHYQTLVEGMLEAAGHSSLVESELMSLSKIHAEQSIEKLILMFDAGHRSPKQEALRTKHLDEVGAIKSLTEIIVGRGVGAGGEGKVFEGKFNRKKVAIKIIKSKTEGHRLTKLDKEGIENELMLMKAANHPSVLSVYGYFHDELETLIVLELAIDSLEKIIEDRETYPALPLSLSIAWLMDVASAVQHLHEKRIRHKDIKAQNMLLFSPVGSRLVLKIGDFGLAKATTTAVTSSTGGASTKAFSAPEYENRGETYTFACDVYSVGMTGVQILSRRTPKEWRVKRPIIQINEVFEEVLVTASGPAIAAARGPTSVHSCLLGLLQSSTSDDPNHRPHAKELANSLETLLKSQLNGDPRDEDSESPDYDLVVEIDKKVRKCEDRPPPLSVFPLSPRPPAPVVLGQRKRQTEKEKEERQKEKEERKQREAAILEAECKRLAKVGDEHVKRGAAAAVETERLRAITHEDERDSTTASESTAKDLLESAYKGDVAVLGPLLLKWAGNAVVDMPDPSYYQRTPLMAANRKGNSEAVRLLLSTPGVEVNKADQFGYTALILASSFCHTESVHLMLSHPGIEVNKADKDGHTALMWAALNGLTEVARPLLAHPEIAINATVTGGYSKGMTALGVAIKSGHQEVVKLLRKNGASNEGSCNSPDSTPQSRKGSIYPHKSYLMGRYKAKTEAEIAANKAKKDSSWGLLKDPKGKQIYDAAKSGDMSELQKRVDKWFANDVLNWRNPDGDQCTPLIAASNGGKTEAVRLLLSTPGIEVNKADKDGYTALISSSIGGRIEILELLLAHPDIDVDAIATCGYYVGLSALGVAIKEGKGEVAAILRMSGAKD